MTTIEIAVAEFAGNPVLRYRGAELLKSFSPKTIAAIETADDVDDVAQIVAEQPLHTIAGLYPEAANRNERVMLVAAFLFDYVTYRDDLED